MTDLHVLYRAYDKTDALLYVGITLNVSQRFAAHQYDKSWWHRVCTIRLQHFGTREELELAERAAILAEKPERNRLRPIGEPLRRSPVRRESDRRQAAMTDAQKSAFRDLRKIGHQGRDMLRLEIRRAEAAGLSDDDIEWAFANPVRYWGERTNHPQSRAHAPTPSD